MMDDHDLNSDPAAAMVTAMEELWQNQTYIPIKGWGAPFTGPDHYTDVTGEKSLSNWDFPDLSPLPGWKWTTKWTVDKSGSFGQTDSDGWCYETTFDRLVDTIKANKAHGSDVATSIVRRRRYIRMRTCVTAEATAQMRARTTALLDIRNKFEVALREKKTDYALTMQYERERKRICGDSWIQMSSSIKECQSSIQSNISKLEYIKQYYQEIADAEREHSRRLAAICSKAAKWESSKADLAAEDAASEEGSEELASALRLECGDTRSSIAQFYKAMNATNMAMSSGLKNISDLITEDIFQVIDSNINDMKSLQQELKDEIGHIDTLKAKEEVVAKALIKLDSSFYAVSKADDDEVLRLSRVISGEMTDDAVFLESLARSAKTGEPVQTDVYSYFYAGASRDGEDMWASHYAYRQAVQSCWDSFNHVETSVNKAALLKVQCNQATCIVLTTTRRMFMKEQSSSWNDAFPTDELVDTTIAKMPLTIQICSDSFSTKSFSSAPTTPCSANGESGTESFVFERLLPILPPCTSVLKEGPIKYCSGEDTRKAIVALTTNLGGPLPGASKSVTGIPWQRLWGILSSDGTIHILSNEEETEGKKKERVLIKSIPVKGSEIIIHSSDFGLFPLMMEIVPKNASLMETVMQGRHKDAYILGSSDADTEVWFTAIMHPVIGAIYTRHSGGSTSTIGSQKSNSAVTIKSPHRKNSLTPGSNATMVAAAAVAAAAISEDSKPIETISMAGETYVTNNSKITGKSISQVTAGTTTVSSPNADTALKRSESALIEAAKLAEGWRFSETDDILLVDEDTNAAEEGDESL